MAKLQREAIALEGKGPVVVWSGLVVDARGWLWAGACVVWPGIIARDVLRKVTDRIWSRRGG